MDSVKEVKIFWGKEVLPDSFRITDFIYEVWGSRIVFQFRADVRSAILRISQYPKIYPVINAKSQIRRCIVNKHVVLHYHFQGGKVGVLRIYPTRMKRLEFGASN